MKKDGILAIAFVLLTVVFTFSAGQPARADLKACNLTNHQVALVIGYRDKSGWVTEGWFKIKAKSCPYLIKGKLNSRYYYIHARHEGLEGEWSGTVYMCIRKFKKFTIRGARDCAKRGYRRAGFFEIDTINQQHWTVRLTEPGNTGAKKNETH